MVLIEQALASSEILVSFMEDCAKVVDTQGVQAEQASMPLAAAVADLLKGVIHSISLWFDTDDMYAAIFSFFKIDGFSTCCFLRLAIIHRF